MNAPQIQFSLEIINGVLSILGFSLAAVCGAYLRHEVRARKALFRREKWTKGMRVAAGIAAMALGMAITRSDIFSWRHFHNAQSFSQIESAMLFVGAVMDAIGLVCLIRELATPLFGKRPLLVAIAIAAIFMVAEIALRNH